MNVTAAAPCLTLAHPPPPGFFSQFGRLLRVRVSRSKKTGKAKHYAFLEFQLPDVAAIAADTMDGYFLFKQVSALAPVVRLCITVLGCLLIQSLALTVSCTCI